jgi:hypothetical protein
MRIVKFRVTPEVTPFQRSAVVRAGQEGIAPLEPAAPTLPAFSAACWACLERRRGRPGHPSRGARSQRASSRSSGPRPLTPRARPAPPWLEAWSERDERRLSERAVRG